MAGNLDAFTAHGILGPDFHTEEVQELALFFPSPRSPGWEPGVCTGPSGCWAALAPFFPCPCPSGQVQARLMLGHSPLAAAHRTPWLALHGSVTLPILFQIAVHGCKGQNTHQPRGTSSHGHQTPEMEPVAQPVAWSAVASGPRRGKKSWRDNGDEGPSSAHSTEREPEAGDPFT